MWFTKRTKPISGFTSTGHVLGGTVEVPLTREFPIETIFVRLTFTVGTGMATANPDSLQNILNGVDLQVFDGVKPRSVVKCSGPALLEYQVQTWFNLDRVTAANVNTNTTGAKVLTYVISCAHPQLSDPLGSSMLLPVHLMPSNPTLTLRLSTQAEMDVNATPTFALTGTITVDVWVARRQVSVVRWPYLEWDLIENTQAFPQTVTEFLVELPTPGSHTGQLYRCYTSVSARGDIQTANSPWRIESLGVVFRQWLNSQLQVENDLSRAADNGSPNFTASFFNDYLTDKTGMETGDFGSVLDANVPVTSGARIYLVTNVTGGTGVQMKILTHRVYGDLSRLKFVR